MSRVDKEIKKATKAACQIKRADQVGSFAWTVRSNKKRYHVQTDAEPGEGGGAWWSFLTCTCEGLYLPEDRMTICPHTIRVLMEIGEDSDDEE